VSVSRLCTDGYAHDWRYASYAPGWKVGDTCVICEKCGIRKVWTKDDCQ
jgi:hypothetical protein